MHRLNVVILVALLTSGAFAVLLAQDGLTLDATKQIMRPLRASGPFPGSATPGHSDGFPIRLDLRFLTIDIPRDGSALFNFVMTNLTLWITSDAVIDQYAKDVRTGELFKISSVGISAELDGGSRDPQSFCTLNPGQSMQVHARAGAALKTETHSFTAHAELVLISQGTSKLVGTADSEVISTTLF